MIRQAVVLAVASMAVVLPAQGPDSTRRFEVASVNLGKRPSHRHICAFQRSFR
jgi:hypothetical protein